MMMNESQVSLFYAHRKILVTGGTGFMGKVLIWKLLHSCPLLEIIYVLIRSKHGKNEMSRKEELFDAPIFDNFKKFGSKILDKVILIAGDVKDEGIGLSDADRNMIIKEVSVVFHNAAILKMDADLRTAVNINTEGTIKMLDMAQKMEKLEAFVYVSTAYCCCDNLIVEEKLYPSKHSAYDIINLVRWMEPELLNKITPKLIHPLPNTYVYSKRLTESILSDYVSKVPLIVARPTIVIPAVKEPIPGWVDNINGPVGLFIAGGKGILRVTMMNKNAKSNVIPVDTCIDGILCLPWVNPKEKLMKEIAVFNISQTAYDNFTWEEVTHMFHNRFKKCPYETMLWYPTNNPFTESKLVYKLKCVLTHYVPAYIIDFLLVLFGKKPFLVRMQDKLTNGEKVLRYFTQNQWRILNDKIFQIKKQLSDADKQLFTITMESYSLEPYIDDVIMGTKRLIFKEDDKSIGAARRTLNIMYVIDKVVLVVKYYVLWKIFMFVFDICLNAAELYLNREMKI